MKIRDHAEATAREILTQMGQPDDARQLKLVADSVEKALVQVAVETRNWCADKAAETSGLEHDKAQDIADSLRREMDALIANLSSLR